MRAALHPGIGSGPARLVLGGRFGEQPNTVSEQLLGRFYTAGGRLIETAAAYVDGAAERAVGAWLATGPRDTVCITKVGYPAGTSTAVDVDALARELEQSAERLGLGRLDLVLLHRDDPAKPVAELLQPLLQATADGRVVGVGVANWRAPRLREAVALAAPRGGLMLASEQLSLAVPAVPLWPGTVHADAELLKLHRDLNLPLLAWSANARGWFAGRLSLGNCDDPGARQSFHTEDNVRRLATCRAVAGKHGATSTATALAWTLSTIPTALPVIGPASLVELDDAIAATHLMLSPSDLAKLSSLL